MIRDSFETFSQRNSKKVVVTFFSLKINCSEAATNSV